MNYAEEIIKLKKEKNAVILAHYYQIPEIQDIADYVGDSLGLSKQAASTDADMIVFAGVHFMAETAKIINPSKTVVLPDLDAGCSLADSCPASGLQKLKSSNPNHVVVSYINCSAEVKAMSDIICTSSNAVKVVESIPKNKEIIFAPDKNLGRYVSEKTGRKLLIWDGECEVHVEFSNEKIEQIQIAHPESKLIAHPESQQQILDQSDFIGSTSALLKFVQEDNAQEYIVATEVGILHKMKQLAPDKKFIPAPIYANNTCACSECPYMKLNTLEKIYNCMKNEQPQINVEESTRQAAAKSLDRMLSLA
ncbi:MAG: quinolinate synthase [Bacteroidetes bacterium]|nr:MAG: quinolinate synthase [Bacteroidota bacterium]